MKTNVMFYAIQGKTIITRTLTKSGHSNCDRAYVIAVSACSCAYILKYDLGVNERMPYQKDNQWYPG